MFACGIIASRATWGAILGRVAPRCGLAATPGPRPARPPRQARLVFQAASSRCPPSMSGWSRPRCRSRSSTAGSSREVEGPRVLEWQCDAGSWQVLADGAEIDEPVCLVNPLAVRALLSAAEADNDAARALLAKGNDPARLTRWLGETGTASSAHALPGAFPSRHLPPGLPRAGEVACRAERRRGRGCAARRGSQEPVVRVCRHASLPTAVRLRDAAGVRRAGGLRSERRVALGDAVPSRPRQERPPRARRAHRFA
jgi:hypothetical protein